MGKDASVKIAYINLFYSKKNMSGVERKLKEEAIYYAQEGVDVYLLNDEVEGYQEHIEYKHMYKYISLPSFLAYFYVRLFSYDILSKALPLQAYDVLYLRYPLMDFSALRFAKKYGHKLITQHHTKELEEIKAYKLNPLFRYLQFTLERWISPRFFTHIKGLTAMSDDVIAYEKRRLGFAGETYRFSNGINSKDFTMRTAPPLHNVFHVSIIASHFSPWHGLDRLLKSLAKYDGTHKVHLHIIGQLSSADLALIENTQMSASVILEQHGKLFAMELDEVLLQTHMACDSLAMYRLNMHETSTLKSKEYIARGIPFIYSAFDKDMIGLEAYLYDVKNSDALLDFDDIIRHYQALDLEKMQDAMRRCADEVLDWKIKVNELVKFLSFEDKKQ